MVHMAGCLQVVGEIQEEEKNRALERDGKTAGESVRGAARLAAGLSVPAISAVPTVPASPGQHTEVQGQEPGWEAVGYRRSLLIVPVSSV